MHADPFAFDPGDEQPATPSYRKSRGRNQTSIWATVGGCILVAVVVLGFFLVKEALNSGGRSGGSGMTVTDFKSVVFRLDKNGGKVAQDEAGEILYKVERDAFLAAVGPPSSKVEAGDTEAWFWDCRNGRVQIMIDFTSDSTYLVFKYGIVVQR